MATEKTLKTRVVLKHDTEANWKTAGNAANPFIPKKGEVIIYDPDGTHTYSRQKVGDGIKNINKLPFLGATVGTADPFESLSKIQYTAESAIPTTPEQGVEYAITDLIGYGDLDSELQAKVDAGANAGSNLNTKASVDYVNKTHYGYSGDDLLIIPEGTTTIADNAYKDTNYKCVVIPDSVTTIGHYAFQNCSSLTNITIPDSVTSIGEYAFHNCDNLTSITIPNSVTSIGSAAFYYCDNLANITISNNITRIDPVTFAGNNITNIIIPDGVTTIGFEAFYHCENLTNIKIPNSVTSIADEAFDGCPLRVIDLTAYTTQSFPTIDSLSIYSIASDCQIKVVKGRKAELISTSGWSSYANYVVEVPTVETLDTAIAAVKNGYLPLSGGTISNTLTIGANNDSTVNTLILTNNNGKQSYFRSGYIELWEGDTYPAFVASSDGISINGGVFITGISDTKGTSSTIAASQKCLSDNYVQKDPGNNSQYIRGSLYTDNLLMESQYNGSTVVDISSTSAAIFNQGVSTTQIELTGNNTTITGISDSKGTSSTVAASQKCLNDNYVAKSELPSNLLKYQIVTSTSQIGTDPNTAYLILE